MKWKVTFLDDSPGDEVEAYGWKVEGIFLHFFSRGNPREKTVAAFRLDIVRSIRPVEGEGC